MDFPIRHACVHIKYHTYTYIHISPKLSLPSLLFSLEYKAANIKEILKMQQNPIINNSTLTLTDEDNASCQNLGIFLCFLMLV